MVACDPVDKSRGFFSGRRRRAVGAEQAKDLARVDLEGDALQADYVAVGFVDVVEMEHGCV